MDMGGSIDGTGVKSGIIGEVGCSWPLSDNERKVLRASGRAQRITGAPLLIHPGRDEMSPFEIVDVLRDVGAVADLPTQDFRHSGFTDYPRDCHTIISHVERTVFQKSLVKKLEVPRRACT